MESLKNIGPKSAAWLREAGIHNVDDLRHAGVVGVYLDCARNGHPVSLNLAYALEAALRGVHWRDLPAEDRERLREEIRIADSG